MMTSNSEQLIASLSTYSNYEPQQIHTAINHFYDEVYDNLEPLVQPVDGAKKILNQLRDAGYHIAITTNPFYPFSTVEQRLRWGELPTPESFPYVFITHNENTHFVKPSAAYFAEILARLGYEPDEVLLVGDSEKNDIVPAKQAGSFTFQVSNRDTSIADAWGTLYDLENLIFQEDWLAGLKRRPDIFTDTIIPHYEGNIGALFGFLDETKPHYWSQHPIADEWSILQILSHLYTSEQEIQRTRLERILSEDNPFIVAPMPPGPNIPVCGNDAYEIAELFAAQRSKTIQLIQTITSEQWQRPARHSIFGLTNLLEMAYFTAQHDRLHLKQLCQTLGKCK